MLNKEWSLFLHISISFQFILLQLREDLVELRFIDSRGLNLMLEDRFLKLEVYRRNSLIIGGLSCYRIERDSSLVRWLRENRLILRMSGVHHVHILSHSLVLIKRGHRVATLSITKQLILLMLVLLDAPFLVNSKIILILVRWHSLMKLRICWTTRSKRTFLPFFLSSLR